MTDLMNKPKHMDLVLASDDNYVEPLSVVLTSIIANMQENEEIDIYIIDGGIVPEKKRKLSTLTAKNVTISYVTIPSDAEILNNSPLPELNHLSVVAYYRLFMEKILPTYIDKVLYLDCDMVVKSDLWELYNTDMEEYFVAGVRDIHEEWCCNRLNLDNYVNSGMLLINLKKWREQAVMNLFVHYYIDNKEKIIWHDQDIINATLKNKIKIVDPRWNAQVCTSTKSEQQNIYGREGHILHYISSKKPWKLGIWHPFFNDYQKYHKLSPYKNKKFGKSAYLLNTVRQKQLIKDIWHGIAPDHSKRKYYFLIFYDCLINFLYP